MPQYLDTLSFSTFGHHEALSGSPTSPGLLVPADTGCVLRQR